MKFLITNNFYGFNRGTVALAVTAKSTISKYFPEAKFAIYVPWDDHYIQWYDEMTIVKAPYYRYRFKILSTALRTVFWFFGNRLFGIDSKTLVNREDFQALRECDVVIDLGGDTVTEEYGIQNLLLHFLPLFKAVVFKKPIVAYSQTMGPFRRWKVLGILLFKVFDLIILRDRASVATLRSVDYSGPFECTADTAFCLETASEESVRKIETEEKVDLSKMYIGMSISPMMCTFYEKWNPKAKTLPYYKMMASVLDKIIEAADCNVVLVANVTGGKKRNDDRFAARAVAEYCTHFSRIYCIQGEYSPSEIKGILKNAEVVIGSRMHVNIAALSNCIPTIAIAYSLKSFGIMEVCGQEKWVYPIEELDGDKLFNVFMKLWEKKKDVRIELSKRIPAIHEMAASNGKIFADWYESKSSC